ncbi:MAG: SpoIID/LytB domain-containing protein [Candidatus Sumerlaeota bacterium]|nr:SpoIID/LytB domain-containing protein [Candidatus Sumerlaeota bacterium]
MCFLFPSPASAESLQALRDRNFPLRIKLSQFAGAATFWVQCDAGLQFVGPSGQVFLETDAGERLAISPEGVSAAAVPICYRLLLKRFDSRRDAELFAQNRGVGMGLMTEIIESDGKSAVVVGRFSSKAVAEQAKSMVPQIKNCEIISAASPASIGALRVAAEREGRGVRAPMNGIIRPRAKGAGGASAAEDATLRVSRPGQSGVFRGQVQFFAGNGGLFPVNTVNVEDYVRSVVPAEIGAHAPFEALKAQAIAARSEAIHKTLAGGRYGDDHYELVSTAQDQVYNGVGEESLDSTRAARDTASVVLMKDGQIIDAVYSHSCGGVTANSEDLWPGRTAPCLAGKVDRMTWTFPSDLSKPEAVQEWLRSSPDVYCNEAQEGFPEHDKGFFRWKRTVKGSEIAELANDRGFDIGKLKGLRVVERSASGRVRKIELQGTEKTVTLANGDAIRVIMGVVPSTFFTFTTVMKDNLVDEVQFEGAGYGHGVGLCQMGAVMMGQRGFTCEKILQHYYTGAEIQKVY